MFHLQKGLFFVLSQADRRGAVCGRFHHYWPTAAVPWPNRVPRPRAARPPFGDEGWDAWALWSQGHRRAVLAHPDVARSGGRVPGHYVGRVRGCLLGHLVVQHNSAPWRGHCRPVNVGIAGGIGVGHPAYPGPAHEVRTGIETSA
jgi:hypothetical protein